MDPHDGARPWLVPVRRSPGAEVDLFCFPHAGGAASYFFPWGELLAPAVDVWAVQYPGRYERRAEPMPGDLFALAAAVTDAVGPVLERRRCLFFGHSMGAVIAYEVARGLSRDGLEPGRLVVSGRRSPTRHREDDVHRRDDAAIISELRTLGGPGVVLLDDPELRALFLPVIRQDYALVEAHRHVPGPVLQCPLTVLTGDADPRVDEDEARAWATLTTGPTELHVRPGGHFYLDTDRTFVTDLLRRHASDVTAAAS